MNVVLLTGRSGSGKSAIARLLGERLGARLLVEREIFKLLARTQGFSRGRAWVAVTDFGKVLRQSRALTIDLIASSRGYAIVMLDGAYDRALPAAIERNVAGAHPIIVAVTAPFHLRLQRVAERLATVDHELARREIEFLDGLKERAGMFELEQHATLVIKNSLTLELACRPLLELVQSP